MRQAIQFGVWTMADVLTLVSKTITTDKYLNEVVQEAERTVYCEVYSITQTEFYAAANTELNPEFRFDIFFGDYEGEDVCIFNGNRYAIYRTYRTGDTLELYAERKIGA